MAMRYNVYVHIILLYVYMYVVCVLNYDYMDSVSGIWGICMDHLLRKIILCHATTVIYKLWGREGGGVMDIQLSLSNQECKKQ